MCPRHEFSSGGGALSPNRNWMLSLIIFMPLWYQRTCLSFIIDDLGFSALGKSGDLLFSSGGMYSTLLHCKGKLAGMKISGQCQPDLSMFYDSKMCHQ